MIFYQKNDIYMTEGYNTNKITSLLDKAVVHLAKFVYQPFMNCGSWYTSTMGAANEFIKNGNVTILNTINQNINMSSIYRSTDRILSKDLKKEPEIYGVIKYNIIDTEYWTLEDLLEPVYINSLIYLSTVENSDSDRERYLIENIYSNERIFNKYIELADQHFMSTTNDVKYLRHTWLNPLNKGWK